MSTAREQRAIGEIIGRGRVADVHSYGDFALKLYQAGWSKAPAYLEAAILAILESHDLPAPRVHEVGSYDGRWGLVMDRIAGQTLGEQMLADPGRIGTGLDEMARLQLRVHAAADTRLRSLKARLAERIADARALDAALQNRLLAQLAEMPDGDRLCHGDFHPYNIIGQGPDAMIVDWLDTTVGPPAADACRSYLLLTIAAPQIAEPYLDRYIVRSRIARDAVLAWLPLLAAARLAEGIDEEETLLLRLASSG
jgi:Ser/Thr protein kinase RdoA (MazF antagonist)